VIRPADSLEVPAPRKRALGLAVVVLMHVLFFWGLHAGLGRELLQSTPVVVVAQLLSDAPAPTPQPAPPVPVPVPPPQAATPVPKPMIQPPAPVLEPSPVVAVPAPAIALSAPPAPPAPQPSPAPAVAAAPVAALPAQPPAPAVPAVRVAASLQATGNCQKPEYPPLSRRREEQGSVVLKFLIGTDGRVLESRVEQSSGHARLDEAARLGLSQCQFKPGTVDGKPEPSWASLKYTWRLE
jgi:protein TonB